MACPRCGATETHDPARYDLPIIECPNCQSVFCVMCTLIADEGASKGGDFAARVCPRCKTCTTHRNVIRNE